MYINSLKYNHNSLCMSLQYNVIHLSYVFYNLDIAEVKGKFGFVKDLIIFWKIPEFW